jgi:predicted nuclease of restriction endonuclease-like (RecB) superfamily
VAALGYGRDVAAGRGASGGGLSAVGLQEKEVAGRKKKTEVVVRGRPEEQLFERVAGIIESARGHVARSVNSVMVNAYWLVGREIAEDELRGKHRADYGERVVKRLAERLGERFGKGFSYPNVKRMRQFYLGFPEGSALGALQRHGEKGSAVLSQSAPGEKGSAVLSPLTPAPSLFPPMLGWTHYLVLLRVENTTARAFYEIEAARECWSTRELERQVASLLFERLAASKNKEAVLAMGKRGQDVSTPRDVIKDPMVLEFLGLAEKAVWLERDIETAIIDHLQEFLLELGKGFCFVARQKRISVDGDHFFVDLVFYNRLLKAFVLADLKLGKLTHQDLGQMQMYVHWFDRFQRREDEAPTIGIILCSDKNDAMVRITLPKDNEQLIAARYKFYLPTEDELRREVMDERIRVERSQHLLGDVAATGVGPASSGARDSADGDSRLGQRPPRRSSPRLSPRRKERHP